MVLSDVADGRRAWGGAKCSGFYDTLRETRYHDDLWFFDLSEMKWVKAVLPENSAKPRSARAPPRWPPRQPSAV